MKQQIHFIGIGGTGMGPLAKVYLEMGWSVSGSDLQPSETTAYLISSGAKIFYGHKAENIKGALAVVYSSAIPADNPEVEAAKHQGVALHHRSELWAELVNKRRGIAVGGAHGKTTITSMIAWIMEMSQLDPLILIGARFAPFGPGAKFGHGEFAVAEADESDCSFLRYRPELAIITSIEPDHLENYGGEFSKLIAGYHQFGKNVKPGGKAVLCVDDEEVRKLAKMLPDVITYGFSETAEWQAHIVEQDEHKTRFRVKHCNQLYGEFQLAVPGRHNVSNALAAIAVCHQAGLEVAQIQETLPDFKGAQRRFQILGEQQGIIVVDDYAHHPTEIATTLRATREGWNRRIIAVFQPHRYTRTQSLFDQFVTAFHDADIVIITDIYSPPHEQPIRDISAQMLADRIREEGVDVRLVLKQADIATYLQELVRPGDIVLTMGAGSIWQVAHELITALDV